MSNESSLSSAELNDRIRILEDNIRQLIEQAAAASGERNEARIADRLSQQNEELERLTRERDARSKKSREHSRIARIRPYAGRALIFASACRYLVLTTMRAGWPHIGEQADPWDHWRASRSST